MIKIWKWVSPHILGRVPQWQNASSDLHNLWVSERDFKDIYAKISLAFTIPCNKYQKNIKIALQIVDNARKLTKPNSELKKRITNKICHPFHPRISFFHPHTLSHSNTSTFFTLLKCLTFFLSGSLPANSSSLTISMRPYKAARCMGVLRRQIERNKIQKWGKKSIETCIHTF